MLPLDSESPNQRLQRARAARVPRSGLGEPPSFGGVWRVPLSRKPLDATWVGRWQVVLIGVAAIFMSACAQSSAERAFLRELKQAESDWSSPHRGNAASQAGYGYALRLGEKAFGRFHPVLVLPLSRLGQYKRVLSIYDENPTLTDSTWRLYARARNVLGRDLTRQEATYLYKVGKAVTFNALAAEADRLGRVQQAESFSREALHVLLTIDGHPSLRSQFAILRQYCYQRRNWQCAEHWARRIVNLDVVEARTSGRISDVGRAVNLQSLAAICAQQGRANEAAALYARAWEGYQRGLRRNDPSIVNCLEEYANVLVTLGRGADAEQLRMRASQAGRAAPSETGEK